MNRPYDVAGYTREYKDDGYTPGRWNSDTALAVMMAEAMLDDGSLTAALHVHLHNGQTVIVRPLSDERLRQRLRQLEDDRKARARFIPTMNLDGTVNRETATRIAMAKAKMTAPTACTHLGPRGWGE